MLPPFVIAKSVMFSKTRTASYKTDRESTQGLPRAIPLYVHTHKDRRLKEGVLAPS